MPAIYPTPQQTTSANNVNTFFNELINSHKKTQETFILLGLFSNKQNRFIALPLPEPHELHVAEMECRCRLFSSDHGTAR